MKMPALLSAVITLLLLTNTESARILGFFPALSYSHYIMGHILMNELALRGHEVTVIGTYTVTSAKYNFVKMKIFMEEHESKMMLFDFEKSTAIMQGLEKNKIILAMVRHTLEQGTIQEFLRSNNTFDLVVLDEFEQFALLGLCHHYKASCAILSSTGLTKFVSSQVANPLSPAYISDYYQPFDYNMSFFERLINSITYVVSEILMHAYVLPRHNEILHEYFPDAPHIYDLFYNMSLIFINQHVSTHAAVPLVPNVIEIGGLHIRPLEKLPRDLQNYLDGAVDGAIYFSMGSFLKCSDISIEKREQILRVFGKLKQKVLWKCDAEGVLKEPPNVIMKNWLPQQEILAHPNLKLIITHGGLLSIIEAVHFSLPILGIPIYADQKMNIAHAVSNGICLAIPYSSLSEDTLFDAISELLTNPKFKATVQEFSRIMHDQPMKPLDKAVFWTEYIIRHKGALHLRSPAVNLFWYQYLLLDVVGIVVLVALAIGIVVKIMVGQRKHFKEISAGKKSN